MPPFSPLSPFSAARHCSLLLCRCIGVKARCGLLQWLNNWLGLVYRGATVESIASRAKAFAKPECEGWFYSEKAAAGMDLSDTLVRLIFTLALTSALMNLLGLQ